VPPTFVNNLLASWPRIPEEVQLHIARTELADRDICYNRYLTGAAWRVLFDRCAQSDFTTSRNDSWRAEVRASSLVARPLCAADKSRVLRIDVTKAPHLEESLQYLILHNTLTPYQRRMLLGRKFEWYTQRLIIETFSTDHDFQLRMQESYDPLYCLWAAQWWTPQECPDADMHEIILGAWNSLPGNPGHEALADIATNRVLEARPAMRAHYSDDVYYLPDSPRKVLGSIRSFARTTFERGRYHRVLEEVNWGRPRPLSESQDAMAQPLVPTDEVVAVATALAADEKLWITFLDLAVVAPRDTDPLEIVAAARVLVASAKVPCPS
jgi:hypothetical protein